MMLVQKKETDMKPVERLLQDFAAMQPDEALFTPARRQRLQEQLRPQIDRPHLPDKPHKRPRSG